MVNDNDSVDGSESSDTISGGVGDSSVQGSSDNDLGQEGDGLNLGYVTALMGGAHASGEMQMDVPDHIGDGDSFWMTRVGGNPAKPLKVKAIKVEVTEHENGDISLRAVAAKYHPDTAQYESYDGDFDAIQNMMETGGVDKPVAPGPWNAGYGLYNVSINNGEVTNEDYLPSSAPGLLFERDLEGLDDSLTGGAGDDSIHSDLGHDTVEGGLGADSISGGDGDDYISGGEGDDSIDGGADSDTIYGGGGADKIDGGTESDTISGGEGNDTIDGGSGDDVIHGDSVRTENAGFEYDGGEGVARIDGWTNQATGSGGILESWGEDRANLWTDGLETSDGGRFIELDWHGAQSGHGTDHITTEVDLANGEEFTISVDAAARAGYEGESFEVTFNGEVVGTFTPETSSEFTTYSVTVVGSDGQDSIGFRELESENQGAGVLLDNVKIELTDYDEDRFDDSISGGAGDDRIYGQEGDDTIDGGTGSDTLTGGSGRDTFVISENSGADRISDFEIPTDGDPSSGDTLDLSGLTGGSGPDGSLTLDDIQIADDGKGNAELSFPGGESVVLFGISPSYFDSKKKFADVGVPCFAAGSRVQTQSGLVAIENLTLDDVLINPNGNPQTIAWIGKRDVDFTTLQAKHELRPFRLRAGAVGNSTPLWVSPQHGFVVGNYLVRAKHIAEYCGPRVARVDDDIQSVTYFHVFLKDGHGMVQVEGAVSESLWPGSSALASLGSENLLSLVAAHPRAFLENNHAEAAYPGPCFPYASKNDIQSGRVVLTYGHGVNFKRNKRLHQYSRRQELVGEAWFI